MLDVNRAVGKTVYPGRGILAGRMAEDAAFFAYFIMGRSVNSRNRVFVQQDDGIRTQAYDESKMQDPSLVIYAPVRRMNGLTIVTNGDQTDTICDFLARGKSFEDALRSRCFEPDAPHFTPRISMIAATNGTLSFKMSILKAGDAQGASCLRYFYEYDNLPAGEGRFIHTYADNGNPLPSFQGEPESVSLQGTFEELTESIWQGLNADNRVSLWTECVNLATGERKSRIINRNE